MPPEVSDFLLQTATPAAVALSAIALIITSFARGWIVSAFTVTTLLGVYKLLVDQANQRAEDYKEIADIERKRGDVVQEMNIKLTSLVETSAKILAEVSVPRPGTTPEKVN